ncbi:thyrotropin-releasing hormone-degrading ectoenzyme-like isoform X2 [Centruroides vittatus]
MTSLSNMPKLKTIFWDDDWEADIFNTSVKMSTYSLSFFVGRYVSSRNNKITVWYPPKHSNYLITALNFAPKFLKFYEDVLKVHYTLPKLDLVSADWPHRAMENWGLIICSEKLIYSEKFSSGYRQRIIAKILAHEIAHQWFGNLVTPKWWNDIWLSEGLSTYMEHVANTAFFPQWNKVDKTLVLAAKELYPRDCLDEVSAVSKSYNLENSLLEESFDVFTYIKGAVVTRMTRHIFGDDVFWKALSIYLKENSFKNVEEKDFWNYFIKESKHVLSKGGKLDLMESLSTWTKLKGMPIVTANTNYAEGTVFLSQISCRAKTSSEHKRDLWHIPISYVSSISPNFQNNSSNIKYWLTTVNATMENVFMSKSGWLLLNDRSQGYFVVNYDSRNWKLLAKQLKKDNKVFTPDQRFKLLADVAILLDLNYLDWDLSLDIYSYIGNENELSVLQFGVFDRLQKITELIKHNEYEDVWNEFLIYILRPIYDKVGWKYQPLIDLDEMRDIDYKVVQQLCDIGYEPCVNEALRRFHLWKTNNKNGGEALYEDTVLCMGIKYGTQEDWEEFYDEDEDDEAILSALTCSEDPENIQRLLEMVYEENDITKFVTVVQGILRNSKLWFAYYDFLDENFVDFVENHVRYQFLLSIKDETEAYNPVKYDKLISTCKKNIGTSKKLRAKARNLLKYDDDTVSRMNNMLDKIIHWLKNKSWTEKN